MMRLQQKSSIGYICLELHCRTSHAYKNPTLKLLRHATGSHWRAAESHFKVCIPATVQFLLKHRGHSQACSVPCHLEMGLLQHSPCRSFLAHHLLILPLIHKAAARLASSLTPPHQCILSAGFLQLWALVLMPLPCNKAKMGQSPALLGHYYTLLCTILSFSLQHSSAGPTAPQDTKKTGNITLLCFGTQVVK